MKKSILDDQIEAMIETTLTSDRKARRHGLNLGWSNHHIVVSFAIGKLSRIFRLDEDGFSVIDSDKTAEELRESASYLLRAAQIIDNKKEKNEQKSN